MKASRKVEEMRSLFLKLYASVPDKLRGEVVALVDGKTHSWNSAFFEVSGNTALGEKILKKLEEIGLFEENP